MVNRGIQFQDIQHYLNTQDSDILSPDLIANIKTGAKMLVNHIGQNDKIFIQIDSDCDGYTSAALLINYLNCICPSFVQNNISYKPHSDKSHGIVLDAVPADVKLVIAPDSSSNDYEVHKALAEKGIDVLVIDHHEAPKVSDYACVINNQLCDYPTKSLSGVGMVYKFCCYLDKILSKHYAENFIDLVALGEIADVMDLRDFETKHLVAKGIQNIYNPYFKSMVLADDYHLGNGITPFKIAFYIAPYINAVNRSGTYTERLLLFEAMLDFKAYEMIPSTKRGCKGQLESRVEQACRSSKNIKNRQTKNRDASLEIIKQVIIDKDLLKNKILLIPLENPVDTNLSGLIANQLMSEYQRPVLLLNKVIKDEEAQQPIITWEGSGRGYEQSELKDFKQFLTDSGYFIYAEGHANAFGAGIQDKDLNNFIEYSNKKLANFDFTPRYRVDFIYDLNNLNKVDLVNITEWANLWGKGVEEPLIALENISINGEQANLFKGRVLNISLPYPLNDVSLIKFGSSEEEYANFDTSLGCVTINVIGKCELNYFNNQPQIIIEDYEIVKKTEYYF